jgi:hypothetical protein
MLLSDGNFAAGLTLRFPRVKYIRHDRASKSAKTAAGGDDADGDAEEKIWDAWDSVSR